VSIFGDIQNPTGHSLGQPPFVDYFEQVGWSPEVPSILHHSAVLISAIGSSDLELLILCLGC